jgi:hypothetical protein
MIQVANFHENRNRSMALHGQNTEFHSNRSRKVENMSKHWLRPLVSYDSSSQFSRKTQSLYGFTWTEHQILLKSVKKSGKYE